MHCHLLLTNVNVECVAVHEQEQLEPDALNELHPMRESLHTAEGILKVSTPLVDLEMSKTCERVEVMQNPKIMNIHAQNTVGISVEMLKTCPPVNQC